MNAFASAKKLVAMLLFMILIVSATMPITAVYASSEGDAVSVFIDGGIYIGESARLIDGTTYVPLREFSEALGATAIVWDEETDTAHVGGEGLEISAECGRDYIIANGRYLYNPSVVLKIDGSFYLPIRSLVKAFDGTVEWIEDTSAVEVTTGSGALESADTYYDADDVYWLSRIISAESRGEPLIGQIAVGNVVLNRVDDGYAGTIYGVIFDNRFGVQFTPASSGTIYNTPADISVVAAKICLEGFSLNEDMLYFYEPALATTSWIDDNCNYIFTIGCHRFYS